MIQNHRGVSVRKKVFKKEVNAFIYGGVISDKLQMIIDNAIMRVDDKRFSVEEAQKYIWDWSMKLQAQGYKFSEYEADFLNSKIKPKYKMNLANSFARSIINIFQ